MPGEVKLPRCTEMHPGDSRDEVWGQKMGMQPRDTGCHGGCGAEEGKGGDKGGLLLLPETEE